MMNQSRFNNTLLSGLVFILIVVLIGYPPVVSWLQQGIQAPFNYFVADTFYYLTVADKSVHAPFYTYDGLYPTNGFHPLWQYSLTLAFHFLADKDQQILFTFCSSLILVALGFAFIALTVLHLTRSVTLTIIATVPGVYGLIFSVIDENTHVNTAWSFINGMESSLSLFFFGIMLYLLIVRKFLYTLSTGKILIFALLLSLLTLSRLDDIFMFIPWLLPLIWLSQNNRQLYQNITLSLMIPLFLIGGYLFYNVNYAGMALPVSGLEKSRWALDRNVYALLNVFISFDFTYWYENTWRILQILVPMLLAGFWIERFLSQHRQEMHNTSQRDFYQRHYQEVIIFCLALYVLVKGLYNFINVPIMDQGSWYFPLSIVIFNLIAVVLIAYQRDNALALIMVLLVTVFLANSFVDHKYRYHWLGKLYAQFYQQRQSLSQIVQQVEGNVGILEFDDGIMNYSLDKPTMSGLGFLLDKQAFQAKQLGLLLDVAYQRGFTIWATLSYHSRIIHSQGHSLAVPSELLTQDVSRWVFKPIYQDQHTGAVFVHFWPKQNAPMLPADHTLLNAE